MKKRVVHIISRSLASPFDEENHPEIVRVFKGAAGKVAKDFRDTSNAREDGYLYWLETYTVYGYKGETEWGE